MDIFVRRRGAWGSFPGHYRDCLRLFRAGSEIVWQQEGFLAVGRYARTLPWLTDRGGMGVLKFEHRQNRPAGKLVFVHVYTTDIITRLRLLPRR
jgi:hypothetical protein